MIEIWEVWDSASANLLADFETRQEAYEFAAELDDPSVVVLVNQIGEDGPPEDV